MTGVKTDSVTSLGAREGDCLALKTGYPAQAAQSRIGRLMLAKGTRFSSCIATKCRTPSGTKLSILSLLG